MNIQQDSTNITQNLLFFPSAELISHGYGTTLCNNFSHSSSNLSFISYVEEGKGTLTLNNKKFKIQAGDLFFISKYVANNRKADKNHTLKLNWISFEFSFQLSKHIKNPVIRCPEALAVFKNIFSYDTSSELLPTFLSADIYQLIKFFLNSEITNKQCQSTQDTIANYVKSVIHSNFSQQINISDIASQLFIHKNYLAPVFKQATGSSPRGYLTAYRLYRGALLISQFPKTSTQNISEAVGYNDLCNFQKNFTAKFGVSPKNFRKLSEEEQNRYLNEFITKYHIDQ